MPAPRINTGKASKTCAFKKIHQQCLYIIVCMVCSNQHGRMFTCTAYYFSKPLVAQRAGSLLHAYFILSHIRPGINGSRKKRTLICCCNTLYKFFILITFFTPKFKIYMCYTKCESRFVTQMSKHYRVYPSANCQE